MAMEDHRLGRTLAERPPPHRVARRVGGHQGGGARGVDRQAGPREAQIVRQPCDGDGIVVLGSCVLARHHGDFLPLAAGVPHESADPLPAQGVAPPARAVQGLVAALHDPALRGGHGKGLVVRDAEELVVELGHVMLFDERAVHDVRLAVHDGVLVLHDIHVLVESLEWNFALGVRARQKHRPRHGAPVAIRGEALVDGGHVDSLDALQARRLGELPELDGAGRLQ
mmetsp:Transcript_99340/g.303764  ORF Transcript_99340/g.303764 Transcript_99340/m.303764 type:complete len:226 (+) Transcript_99340:185-862(+)